MSNQSMFKTATAVTCLLLAGVVWAADPGTKDFKRTDANRDGLISREEYRDRMVEVFYSADSDRDGYLDIDELGDPDPDLMKEADTNSDDRLQLREFLNRRVWDFEQADGDADGMLSVEEASEF